MQQIPAQEDSSPHFDRRFGIALSCFLLSALNLFFVVAMVVAVFHTPPNSPSDWRLHGLAALWLYAWTAWIRMAFAWANDRRLGWFWPVTGTLAGLISVLSSMLLGAILGLPALLLALYMSGYHLRRPAARPAADT